MDSTKHIVRGLQFFEEYDTSGVMQRRTMMDIQFCPLNREEFEALAASAGFRVVRFYGDYAYSAFQEATSPSMVWVLEKP